MATKAKKQTSTVSTRVKVKVKRKGIHSKKKNSQLKTSKNYKKIYASQGHR